MENLIELPDSCGGNYILCRNRCPCICCWQGWRLICSDLLRNLFSSLPGCKITVQEAHLLLFWVFFVYFCPLCPRPRNFWSTANFLSLTWKFCYVFSSLCVAVFSYQRTSYTALLFLWDLPILFIDFYPLLLPSIPVWLQAVLSLRKEKPDTVWDPKLGMPLTWLSCLLVKLQ